MDVPAGSRSNDLGPGLRTSAFTPYRNLSAGQVNYIDMGVESTVFEQRHPFAARQVVLYRQAAKARPTRKHDERFKRPAPAGFASIRIHDLKQTFVEDCGQLMTEEDRRAVLAIRLAASAVST